MLVSRRDKMTAKLSVRMQENDKMKSEMSEVLLVRKQNAHSKYLEELAALNKDNASLTITLNERSLKDASLISELNSL